MSLPKLSRLLLLSVLTIPFAACSFGDDRRTQGVEGPDASTVVDAMRIDAPPGIDAPTEPRVFEMRLDPPTPIPDSPAAGISISFAVTGVTYTTGLDVQVDITHTFRGDIRLRLLRGTNLIATLKEKSTDTSDNIMATYPISVASLGSPYNGMYSLQVSDLANLDTGAVNLVKLTFKVD